MKGEKVVTVLCKSVVNPTREEVWPAGWQKPHPALERKPFAFVEGVFMRDGEVWLLLSNAFDGKMTESKAVDWAIEKRGW